jgi:hypothetical protein
MPTETLEPNSCDKTTSGWDACESCSASGESCDCSGISSCDGGANAKSGARFHNFDSPAHQGEWDDCEIKVDWKIYAKTTSCNVCQLVIQYSTNGGGAWNNFSGFPKDATYSDQTGTATQSLSTGQNISNVQVRMYGSATSCSPCPGGSERCGFYEMGKWFCWNVDNCGECTEECNPGGC